MTNHAMRNTLFSPASLLRIRARHCLSVLAAGTLLLVSGCLYRMDVQQGNFLDPSQVVQLQNGMTKSQVRFLLGTPMVPNGFNNDRWNYYYYVKTDRLKQPISKRLTVYFKEDIVDHFERPDDTEAVAKAMAEANEKAMKRASESSATPAPATPAVTPPGAPSTTPANPVPQPAPRL